MREARGGMAIERQGRALLWPFLLLAGCIYGIALLICMRLPVLPQPQLLANAVSLDLTVTLTLGFWLLIARPQRLSWATVAACFAGSLLFAELLLPSGGQAQGLQPTVPDIRLRGNQALGGEPLHQPADSRFLQTQQSGQVGRRRHATAADLDKGVHRRRRQVRPGERMPQEPPFPRQRARGGADAIYFIGCRASVHGCMIQLNI